MQWCFVLPLPPSVNHQYTERDGRWVLSHEGRHYKSHLQKAFKQLKASGKFKFNALNPFCPSLFDEEETLNHKTLSKSSHTPNEVYLKLRLDFYFKTSHRRDLDNGLKIAQDLICTALGVDDRNVVAVELVKHVSPQDPRLEVRVNLLSGWNFSATSAKTEDFALDLRPFVPPLSPHPNRSKRKSSFNLTNWLVERER